MKSDLASELALAHRRSPQGERGLKSLRRGASTGTALSLPARGARIEILAAAVMAHTILSLPARGARIEIQTLPPYVTFLTKVAPRKGSAD